MVGVRSVHDAAGIALRRVLDVSGPGTENSGTDLSDDDRRILDWVADTYGSLTTAQITELSHQEIAYRSTRTGEPIAYRYSEFLNALPPKDLLRSA